MVAAAIPTVLMIGLLALQLMTVERQRRIAARQEGRAKVSLEAVRDQGGELLRQSRGAVPELGTGLRRADRLVRAIARNDGPRAIAAAGELAERLQNADLAGRVEVIARAVVETVMVARDTLAVSRQIEAIARDTGADVETLRAVTIRFQRETLGLQRETLEILRRSLAVQEETLVRVRSIDERTGALVPTSSP